MKLVDRGAEDIEIFIEDQALLRSYELAPPQPPSTLSLQQAVSLSQSSCVSSVELTDGRGGGRGMGEEPNHTIA